MSTEDDLTATLPHLAPRDEDAATVAQLAAQGRQLVADLAPTLSHLMHLVPASTMTASLLSSVPQLVLRLFPFAWGSAQERTVDEIPSILRAFAALARHAQRLHPFPALKTQFWLDMLQPNVTYANTFNVQKSEFMRPSFPEFVIEFDPRHHLTLVVDEALGDALVAFMTEPPAPGDAVSAPPSTSPFASSTAVASFGIAFRRCHLRVASLEILERFLDRTFASPTRQFNLRLLDLSDDFLMPPDLDVLARIVRKCGRQYDIEALRLDTIVPPYDTGSDRADYVIPQTTPAPLLDIARSVFAMDALPTLASRPSSPSASPSPPSRLRKISFRGNALCPEFFATRFSALRYGCPLKADTTWYVAKSERSETWEVYSRWLAFGLFYPRPKRFASRLKLDTIGYVEHCPLSAKTIARTLRNPAAELIFGGTNEHEGKEITPTTELLVCVVKAGASVEVFQTGKSETPEWTDTIPDACELEAIYERADGSVCVVLPGVGLGWVRADSIERIEREPLSAERNEQDGFFTGDLAEGSAWHGATGTRWDAEALSESMQLMVETLGRQFRALRFGHNCFARGFLPKVLACCPHLKYVGLNGGKEPVKQSGAMLLDALSGTLGERLEALELDVHGTGSSQFYDRLFSILGNVENRPALRELQLHGHVVNLKQLEALHALLQVNQTLVVVRVHLKHAGQVSASMMERLTEMKDELNADFHGQLLHRETLPSNSKCAFLSVVKCQAPALDAWVLATVFAFAADHEVRRMLLWNE